MKKLFFILFTFLSVFVFGQIPVYYNDVNLTLTGQALKNELANKITVTHTNQLNYSDVWTTLQQTDLDPTNSNNVLLLYGYNDGDGNPITDRTRNKNLNGVVDFYMLSKCKIIYAEKASSFSIASKLLENNNIKFIN